LKKYVEVDGMIHSDIFQIGAETGRTSSRGPNQQNQINEHEYRECYISDSDSDILCVADWGSNEPRIAAFLTQDGRLIEILNSLEKSLYIEIAQDALGIEITKKSPEYAYIKSTILGIFYGMTPAGLSKRIKVPKKVAAEMINKILETYPGIGNYIERQTGAKANEFDKTEFPECGYVTSIYGRKIWLNPYDWGWTRNALNAPIQSSAADAMKIAAYRVCEEWQPGFYDKNPLKLLIHDELGAGVHKSEQVKMSQILKDVMTSVSEEMHPGIKAIAEVGCADNWADAK
jgi:DNA polymerase-1